MGMIRRFPFLLGCKLTPRAISETLTSLVTLGVKVTRHGDTLIEQVTVLFDQETGVDIQLRSPC
jgi:hypothetical protein